MFTRKYRLTLGENLNHINTYIYIYVCIYLKRFRRQITRARL